MSNNSIHELQKQAVEYMKNAKNFDALYIVAMNYMEWLDRNKEHFSNYAELLIEEDKVFHTRVKELRNKKD